MPHLPSMLVNSFCLLLDLKTCEIGVTLTWVCTMYIFNMNWRKSRNHELRCLLHDYLLIVLLVTCVCWYRDTSPLFSQKNVTVLGMSYLIKCYCWECRFLLVNLTNGVSEGPKVVRDVVRGGHLLYQYHFFYPNTNIHEQSYNTNTLKGP